VIGIALRTGLILLWKRRPAKYSDVGINMMRYTRTSQLEAMVDYARSNGLKPVLYVYGEYSEWVAKNFDVKPGP
jgi:hypothetical protein